MLLNHVALGASEDNQNPARPPRGYVPARHPRGLRSAQRRRLLAAQRQAQVWRLQLGLIGALLLLIVMTAASYRTTESVVQRQITLNTAYRSHILFTDLDGAVRRANATASAFVEDGSAAQLGDYRRSLAESRKILTTLQARSPAPWNSSSERYTDLVPSTRLYLNSLQTCVDLHDVRHLRIADSDFTKVVQLSVRLRAEEEQQLSDFTQGMVDDADRERNRMWLHTSLFLLLLGAIGLFFSRDLGARTRQEQELRSANRTLTRLAEQDGLTQLKNRRALEEELHTEWARSRRYRTPLSLLFVDVDKFKQYNDTFGHQAGDEALKQVADLLRKEEQLSGCCVARYGGEEFALVMPQTDKEEALQISERVRASFEAVAWQGRPVTASVGAATLSQGPRSRFGDVETLLYEADGALYHAKREGRNRIAHADDLFPLPPAPPVSAAPVRTTVR